MADKDQDGPSLELPSLGFGRKRKRRGGPDHAPADAPADAPTPDASERPVAESEVPEPVAAEPVAEPVAAEQVGPAPVEPPPTEPEPEPELEPEPVEPEPPTEVIAPTPSAAEPQRPLFADEAPTRLQPAAPAAAAHSDAEADTEADTTGGERKAKREFALPDIGGMPAAVLTGLLVGVLTVGLTWAGFRLCEVVQGTSSCGKPGFLLLVAIVIVMIYLGGALLKAFRVTDPGSTSFLAVGLMAVVVLLFLVDVLFSWSMIIVIPIVAMATYALAHWVTTAFIEPAED
jgi:hypothetical protein